MRETKPPFVREQTCACGAKLRIEDRMTIPYDFHFKTWEREHMCPVRPVKVDLGNVDNTADVEKPVATKEHGMCDYGSCQRLGVSIYVDRWDQWWHFCAKHAEVGKAAIKHNEQDKEARRG